MGCLGSSRVLQITVLLYFVLLLNKASGIVIYAAWKMFTKQLRDEAKRWFCYENQTSVSEFLEWTQPRRKACGLQFKKTIVAKGRPGLNSPFSLFTDRKQPDQAGTPCLTSPKRVPVSFSRKSIQGLIIISLLITLHFMKIALYFSESYHVYYHIIL